MNYEFILKIYNNYIIIYKDIKQLLDIYFDNSIIQKEIQNFVKYHEENSTNFDLVPSLQHINSLLNEINDLKLPKLMDQLDNKYFSHNIKILSMHCL
jgi:hypothetical protein